MRKIFIDLERAEERIKLYTVRVPSCNFAPLLAC